MALKVQHPAIAVGDLVRYSAAFLRSTGQHMGPVPFAVGKVLELKQHPPRDLPPVWMLALVEWDTPGIPPQVNVLNLWPLGRPEPN